MIIHHHLGLGDHFVCNGLVNYLSKDCNIDLICKKYNLPTIETLYEDNTNVTVIPILGNNELFEVNEYSLRTKQQIIRIGFQLCDPTNWDRSFYKQVGIDFYERYRLFKLPKVLPKQIIIPYKEYIFVHDQASNAKHELKIDSSLPIFKPHKELTNNLFSLLDIILRAKEIHCIDSCFYHLIDSIPNINSKLYYHNIRKTNTNFQIAPKWSIINYN